MTSNYRYTRDWENQQKRLFTDYDVAGDYDIPIIRPEYDFHFIDWNELTNWHTINEIKQFIDKKTLQDVFHS